MGFAQQVDSGLAEWIGKEVSFPNCMVDRITPATTDADRQAVQETCGVVDRWPVPAEPFTQWIIEDDFPAGRPPLESVGVQFVEDVKPYELMKLRLLNASHQALAYFGAPLGYVLVDEAVRDPLIREYLLTYMASEAAPTLAELPGVDVPRYMETLLERFSNPFMRDTLVRLATDGSTRMATFTLPTVQANLQAGQPVTLGAGMVAAWAQFWEDIARGRVATVGIPADERSSVMMQAALDQQANPTAFIEIHELFGDVAQDDRFRRDFIAARDQFVEEGAHGALRHLLGRA